jgi:hypothetical protein
MIRRLLALVVSALVSGAVVLAASPPATAAAPDYTGIVKLSNCSGSLIRLPGSKDTDPALALTNGHCNENGMPAPGEVQVDRPSNRTMTLLGATGQALGTLRASRIAYSTMTDTDVTLYRLDSSYQSIASRMHGAPLTLAPDHPAAGSGISVVSGYFVRTWTCSIDAVVYRLHEADWVWKDSIRYSPACDTVHGTSGSPVVDNATHRVVGINNTGNDSGQACTLDNPCEVDPAGHVYYRQGLTYGQQTYQLTGCVSSGNRIDLARAGCTLPKPALLAVPAGA